MVRFVRRVGVEAPKAGTDPAASVQMQKAPDHHPVGAAPAAGLRMLDKVSTDSGLVYAR
jgi:hypothetical protein